MASKIVLVTGAYGFIGRHTARFFAKQGWNVIGLGHGGWSSNEWQVWGITEWYPGDITLDSLFTYANEPDVIVHCAGSNTVGFSVKYPFQDYQRTVATTLCVLEFVRLRAPNAKVIYPSSAAVYGVADKLPTSETSGLKPISPYGVHKKSAEELCFSYSKYFGVSTLIVRLFSVYGVGLRKQLLWDACSKIQENEVPFWGTGQETRDWLHVEDVAELLFMAGEHASPDCSIINGGSGVSVTIHEVLTEIFSCFKRPDSPQFTGVTHKGNPVHYMADITRACTWGWKPKKNWRNGIREYVEWFKKDQL